MDFASYRAAGRELYKEAETLPPAGPCEDSGSQRYQVKLFAKLFLEKAEEKPICQVGF